MEKPQLKTVFDADVETRPMSRPETEHFVKLCLAKGRSKIAKGKDLEAAFREAWAIPEGQALPFPIAVGIKRLEVCDPEGEFDTDMIMWTFGVLADRVWLVVLWAYSLSKGRTRVNGQAITLDHWATILHPNGPPTQDALFKLWDAQKGYALGLKCDNYIDTPEAWA